MRAERARRARGILGLLALLACSPDAELLERSEAIRVVGHRGASALAPENTLPALDRAREAGAREVEIDVRMSRDGVPVLFHDAGLDRKTQLDGSLADLDWITLQQAEVGRWFQEARPNAPQRYEGTRIATLDQALERHGEHFFWHIELKARDEALPRTVLEAIDRAGVRERTEVSSFHVPQLEAMRELAPDLPLCLIVPRTRDHAPRAGAAPRRISPDAGIDRAIEHRFGAVALALQDLTEERIARAHENDVAVRAFRLEGDADLERAVALGVDAVTVADPAGALDFLARRRAEAQR